LKHPEDSLTLSITVTPSQYDEAARHAVESVLKRQETPAEVQRYAVVPKDGKDSAGTTQTEQLLQKLVGNENVNKAFVWKEAIQWWACNSKLNPKYRLFTFTN
jgi:hypothetical protein